MEKFFIRIKFCIKYRKFFKIKKIRSKLLQYNISSIFKHDRFDN